MIDISEFETDFDGALQRLVEDTRRETEVTPETEREAVMLAECDARLARALEMTGIRILLWVSAWSVIFLRRISLWVFATTEEVFDDQDRGRVRERASEVPRQ